MKDPYDELHHETGSSNISQATSEWDEKLIQARLINNGSEPVLHTAYRLVNEAVAKGEMWAKCMNCGSPYRMPPATSATFCSEQCGDEFTADLL